MIDAFLDKVRAQVAAMPADYLPDELFSTWDWVVAPWAWAHPRVLGLLTKAAWEMPGVLAVDVDIPLGKGRAKFKPDLVLWGTDNAILLIVDFESANSSDARLRTKDVDKYRTWSAAESIAPPYLVVTSLPDQPRTREQWRVTYTSPTYYNDGHAPRAHAIRSNPFRYWMRHLHRERATELAASPQIRFANFNGTQLDAVVPADSAGWAPTP